LSVKIGPVVCGELGSALDCAVRLCGKKSMSVALIVASSKLALSAGRSRAFSFCRVGAIGLATVLLVFALSHVAAQATQPAQSKGRHAQPVQSKEQQHAQSKAPMPRNPKERHAQPAHSKERQHAQSKAPMPRNPKERHAQPAHSK